jgi:hypothetical protein
MFPVFLEKNVLDGLQVLHCNTGLQLASDAELWFQVFRKLTVVLQFVNCTMPFGVCFTSILSSKRLVA